MTFLITVSEAVRSFADIIGRVYYKGEEFEIKKGKKIVARIVPVKEKRALKVCELNDFFANIPKLDAKEMESFAKDIEDARKNIKESPSKWD
jgi:antitoxin (DNA-binding transcriptional repressor) of toxin-antitoxin stability system